MIFTYWSHPEIRYPHSKEEWNRYFPEFKVFSDSDVIGLIKSERLRKIYTSITIPAARSDVARIILLLEYGGMYVDAHTGIAERESHLLPSTLEKLSTYDVLLFGKGWERNDQDIINVMNTVIAGRSRSFILKSILKRIFLNLEDHYEKENTTKDYVPYEIFHLTGTQAIMDTIFSKTDIFYEYKDMVKLITMDHASSCGFEIYKHYTYRENGKHWSEMQKKNRLFNI
ncbi:hypothetical protein HLH26_18685 [Gluconacetobacter sp. 1b LMG 1731]|uniref:Glycosyltransferase n=1 Tax=Gluconacetobacter dulcium TaxID=2729096 RepID=A0A7W4NXF7_9PROT|nr:glycosyltransferase [Gluconacetobacter dulcium]MBB2166515.1 hypothetical protein [Gluconacetobacter dulcium]MBB2195652.1 hypothetical protein [Gluconacetobacter dulcium]MBB2199312.1 hypothetical protein [Gluconacetobacter dulcium]